MGTMKWEDLLKEDKLGTQTKKEEQGYKDFPINIFEKDYHKIISSSAFRRLQDKTQVFPLDDSDFARTRLTHSIEVSTIAYQLGQMITGDRDKYNNDYSADLKKQRDNIPSLLRCAGVLHDLGNPPFGHFGEATIGLWFQENLGEVKYKGETLRTWLKKLNKDQREELPEEQRKALDDKYPIAAGHANLGDEAIANLEGFEGNAQALRLLCKAEYAGDINVSYAVISSLVKYPTDSLHIKKKGPIQLHKQGVYASEADVFDEISEAMGTKMGTWNEEEDKNSGAGKYCRHPLTFIMEASDDIAYATSDLEDSYKKGMFTLQELREHFRTSMQKEAKNILWKQRLNKDLDEKAFESAFGDFWAKKDDWIGNKVWLKGGMPKDLKLTGMLNSKGKRKARSLWGSVETLEEFTAPKTDDRGPEKAAMSREERDREDDRAFSDWLNNVRAKLMYCVVYKFLTNLDKIMTGECTEDMFEGTFQELTLAVIKSAMKAFVYDAPKTSPTEISGHNSLSFLLDGFVHAALYADKDYCKEKNEKGEPMFKPSDKDKKYWRLISEHFRDDYKQARSGCEPFDLYLRLLTVTDHISAMTDTYAHDLAAKLRGY